MPSYTEKEKNIARKSVLDSAITSLTEHRFKSTLTEKSHVRNVRNKLVSRGGYDELHASVLSDDTILKWESFYSSIVQEKLPSSLKVAYLSGPNPENDLREMTRLGILPENIWAFETDAKTYDSAIVSALASEFPFIKIIKSNIGSFFDVSPQKIDIIYLDFCGPLPSRNKKQKTLKTITNILTHHALNSPGALITNVSLPTEDLDNEGLELIKKLVAVYLYPKGFLESGDLGNNIDSGPETNGYSFEEWMTIVSDNIENYYGQYITRLVMDMVGVILPYDKFPLKHVLFEHLFDISDKKRYQRSVDALIHFYEEETDDDLEGGGGGVVCDMDMYATLWTLVTLSKTKNKTPSAYPQLSLLDKGFSRFSENFLSQLSFVNDGESLVENVARMTYLLSERSGESRFYNTSLKRLEKLDWIHGYPLFCDVVLFHQIKEVIFRQLAIPYHVNVEACRRWRYKAKSTPMYMDMFILDECRYLYDWMPSADMMETSLRDKERQLSFRFALDGVSKHRRYYNSEFFYGTASVGSNNEGFEAKLLAPRVSIE
ncbi:hypothetical protein [Vreelandella titanicae]|uniref:hypothetical protein n=1 Tax=Vreelandella titanicae TaxID=664683 RepID=UPI003FD6FF06